MSDDSNDSWGKGFLFILAIILAVTSAVCSDFHMDSTSHTCEGLAILCVFLLLVT